MFFVPERIMYHHEQGMFALDIWVDSGMTHVHAVQVDHPNSARCYSAKEWRVEAINEAVNYLLDKNKEKSL
jgi:hypothetical protein